MQHWVGVRSNSMGANVADPIQDNIERSRFELDVDGQVVFASYRRQGEVLAIYHVEAPPQLRGTGAAGKLMTGVAEIARQEGRKITPYCGYAAAWLRRHKEYHDLLA
jgi:predicted GNAT family acetyltransferase